MSPPDGMTPFDSGMTQKTLSATSIGALRLFLQTQRTGAMSGLPLRHNDVRRAMRLVCTEVRRRGLPVERLIILLKEQWFTLTDDGDGGNLKSRDALEEIIRRTAAYRRLAALSSDRYRTPAQALCTCSLAFSAAATGIGR
jgi:hypothetical protein